MINQRQRPVHNTNSPNFIKLDYTDLCYIVAWTTDLELSPDEKVTLDRVKLMKELMEEKREAHLKGIE